MSATMMNKQFIRSKYVTGREPNKGDIQQFYARVDGSIYSTGKPAKIEVKCTVNRHHDKPWCELELVETNEKLRQRTISVTLPILVAEQLAEWVAHGTFQAE